MSISLVDRIVYWAFLHKANGSARVWYDEQGELIIGIWSYDQDQPSMDELAALPEESVLDYKTAKNVAAQVSSQIIPSASSKDLSDTVLELVPEGALIIVDGVLKTVQSHKLV